MPCFTNHVIGRCLVALAVLAAILCIAKPAQARYADGMNLYQYVRGNPVSYRDPSGLASEGECYCGPDVTDGLMDLMLRIGRWSKSWDDTVDKPGYKWFIHNGMSFDWRGYRTESCPSSHKECANTYTLCGECVHDHWIGNFIYAYTLKLADFSRWTIHKAGQAVQGPGPGDPPQSNWIHYVDPPWDKAGYDLAIAILEADSSPITGDALCKSLKSNDDLWKKANDTSPTYQSRPRFHGGHVDRYPSPHAKGYDICKPCTETVTEPLRGLPGME